MTFIVGWTDHKNLSKNVNAAFLFRKKGKEAGEGEEEIRGNNQDEDEDELQEMNPNRGTNGMRANSYKGAPFYFRLG